MTLAAVLMVMLLFLGGGGWFVYKDFKAEWEVRSRENKCNIEALLHPPAPNRDLRTIRSCRGLYPDLEDRYADR